MDRSLVRRKYISAHRTSNPRERWFRGRNLTAAKASSSVPVLYMASISAFVQLFRDCLAASASWSGEYEDFGGGGGRVELVVDSGVRTAKDRR